MAKTKPKARKKSKARKTVPINRKPRTPRLPGMEDAGIPALERIAEEYADVRDSRIGLSKREGEMQDDLLALMKKYNKTEYHHEDVHIWVQVTEEKVKVKLGELTPARAKKESKQTAQVSVGESQESETDGEGQEENEADAVGA